MFLNYKKQGDAGVGQAIAWFSLKGYNISIPLTDSQDYDLIVEMDGSLKKVQIKTGTMVTDNGNGIIYMTVSGGNRSGTGKAKTVDQQDWDYLFGYHFTTKQIIFIPKEKLQTKGQLNLGQKYKDWFF